MPSRATMQTNQGPIELELFDEDAPKTVANFKKLAGEGFYDGLIFHRVIKDFMVQGGCPQGTGTGGPGYQFEDEFNDHKIVRGALAMANAGPNTNGSQFFLVTTAAAPQPGWEGLGFAGRSRVMLRMQKWLIDNADRVIGTSVKETGKSWEDAQLAEISYGANAFGFWAKNAEKYLADEKVHSSAVLVK